MAKPTIVTRAGKGSALTWTEGDANVTNLRDATITVKAGTGGTDVVNDLNGTVTLVAGTNVTISGDNTAKTVTINAAGGSGITDVVQDTTPQLGGDLDLNGFDITDTGATPLLITSNTDKNVAIRSQGTGDVVLLPLGSGKVIIDTLNWPTSDGTNNQVLTTNGSGQLSWSSASGMSDLVQDTTPQLGGHLDVNGKDIVSVSNGNINILPNGTGRIQLDVNYWPTSDGTANQVLKTDGFGQLSWTTVSSGGITDVVQDTTPQLGGDLDLNGFDITDTGATPLLITSNTDKNVAIRSQGTGDVILLPLGSGKVTIDTLNWPTSDGTSNQVLTTNGAGQLSWTTPSSGVSLTDDTSTNATRYILFDDSTSGSQTTFNVSSTKLTFNPSTGRLTATELTGSLRAYNEGALYDLGTTGGTVAPNVANGNVQKITLNSALTINAFTSPVAGQSLTLIIYGGTAYTSITSTMKFAGGIKTLTGTAGCIDILSVYYDGTNYFASLGKGFA